MARIAKGRVNLDYEETYKYAEMIALEKDLLTSQDQYLNQIKRYDEYKDSSENKGIIGYQLGSEGRQFTKAFDMDLNKVNFWQDIWPVDNAYFGLSGCEKIKELVDVAPDDNFPNWIKNPSCSD